MKTKLLLMMLCLSFLVMGFKLHPTRTTGTPTVFLSAVKVNVSDFEALTQAYAANHREEVIGGALSRQALEDVLNSMPFNSDFINFRFTTDEGRMTLMLMGGKSWYEGTKKIPCIRNGGNGASFCPNVCDLNVTADGTTLLLPYTEYLERSAQFGQSNANATLGGNLDKSALQALLQSMPAGQRNMSFRFCADPAYGKTSVIFIGGPVGQADNKPLMLRNGVDEFSFCPSHCETRD